LYAIEENKRGNNYKNDINMIKNLLILIALIITISLQAQITYYIDATNGDDINNGLSSTTAWQTIDKINQQTLIAGDSILFKRDEIWRGGLLPQNSGNSNNWIVFSDYGTGAPPQLLGSEQITGWVLYSDNIYKKTNVNLAWDEGSAMFEFDDFNQDPIILTKDTSIPTIAGHWYYDDINETIYIICSDSAAPSIHNIEICKYPQVIDIDNLSYLEFSNFSLKFGNNNNISTYSCDYINITHVNSSFQGHYGNPNICSLGGNHIKIEDCFLYESDNSAVCFYPIGTTRPGHYNTVRGCTISKMRSNDGVTIHADSYGNPPGNYHLVENNVISECTEGSIDAGGGFHVFRNNICFNNGQDAFQVDSDTGPVVIENNLCYGNNRNGILSFTANISISGNIVRNNVVYDNVKYGLITGPESIAIYNNTICNSITRAEVEFGYDSGTSGSTYKNNIVYNDFYNSSIYFVNGLPTGVEMDYNNYHIIESNDDIFTISQTGLLHTLIEMQNIYDREHNSILANPMFVNLEGKEFHLNANSPSIDAGGFLTSTTSSGTGTQIPVDNTIYFCDGYGIVNGDTIQIEGQTQQLHITNVDYPNNIITVDQSVTWNTGDGIALVYNGTAPDIGAYEYSDPLGIAKNKLNNTFEIYPNPTTGKIYISKRYINDNYKIITLTGSVVKSGIIKGNSIDLTELETGIYFIKIAEVKTENIKATIVLKK